MKYLKVFKTLLSVFILFFTSTLFTEVAISKTNSEVIPKTGIYMPMGKDLQISYTVAIDFEKEMNAIANMRLGVEFSNSGIKNGDDVQIFKIPFCFVEKKDITDLYIGVGVVYIFEYFNNGVRDITKRGFGARLLAGKKFNDKFSAELAFDGFRKKVDGYQLGGLTGYLNYKY